MISLQTDVSTGSKECSGSNSTKERGHTAFGDKADQATESKQQAVREGKAEVIHPLKALSVCTALFRYVQGAAASTRSETTAQCSNGSVLCCAYDSQNHSRAVM